MSFALAQIHAADLPVVNELPFPAWTYGAFVMVLALVGLAITLNLRKVPKRGESVKVDEKDSRFNYEDTK